MRYPKGQKAESREKLVRASGALAKQRGFGVSGVDALAASAELTSGAFYKHFASKDALLAAIVEAELEATHARFASIDARSPEALLGVVDAYLSLAHVRMPEAGCLLPTLSAEVARATPEVKAVYEEALQAVIGIIAEKAGDEVIATAIVAQCVGAVMLARAMASDDAKRAVLKAARVGVRKLVELPAP